MTADASAEQGASPPARFASRWLYLLPVFLLMTAAWAWRDQSKSSASFDGDNAAEYPLEPATAEDDPRRYVDMKDGYIEDAATGLRLPAVPGLSPAEVFSEFAPGVDGDAAPSTLMSDAARKFGPKPAVDDLRYGIGPRPAGIVVDSIGVKTWIVAIGVDANRALRVPKRADIAGWWSGGSVPGEVGPTVLVGHYDSKTRPGVFARLKDVEVSDLVVVSMTDGSSYTYYVTEVERLKKVAFPTKRVYGPTRESTLRLVTCGGDFDRSTGHYVENTIAYAELLSFTPSPWPTTTWGLPTTSTSTTSTTGTTTSTSMVDSVFGGEGVPADPTTTLSAREARRRTTTSTTPTTNAGTTAPSAVSSLDVSTTPVPTAPVPTTPITTAPVATTPAATTLAPPSSVEPSTTALGTIQEVPPTTVPLVSPTSIPINVGP